MAKNRFYIYTEYRSYLDGMTDEDQAQLFRTILDYESGDELEELSPAVRAVFSFIKNRLDNNRKEYEKTCEARAEAGKMGGEAKASKTKQSVANGSKPKQKVANAKFSHSDNDNDNENDNDIENDNENEKEKKSLSFSNENDCRAEAQRVIEEWNTLESLGIAPVNTISRNSKRYVMLCSRIREHGEEKVIDAINRIRGSDFLLGRKTDFAITFDWFVKPNNFVKVADGNYSNNARSGTTAEDNRQAFYDKWRDV